MLKMDAAHSGRVAGSLRLGAFAAVALGCLLWFLSMSPFLGTIQLTVPVIGPLLGSTFYRYAISAAGILPVALGALLLAASLSSLALISYHGIGDSLKHLALTGGLISEDISPISKYPMPSIASDTSTARRYLYSLHISKGSAPLLRLVEFTAGDLRERRSQHSVATYKSRLSLLGGFRRSPEWRRRLRAGADPQAFM